MKRAAAANLPSREHRVDMDLSPTTTSVIIRFVAAISFFALGIIVEGKVRSLLSARVGVTVISKLSDGGWYVQDRTALAAPWRFLVWLAGLLYSCAIFAPILLASWSLFW